MIFGVRETRKELGRFSGDSCTACGENNAYRFAVVTRWLVVFFLSLIPIGTRFEAICDSCDDMTRLDSRTGRNTAREQFGGRYAAMRFGAVCRPVALVLIIAAAVLLPLGLTGRLAFGSPTPGPQALKDMVTADGTYCIQDADANVLGIVKQQGGKKTLTCYEKTSRLVGEPGADGSFIRQDDYQETTGDGDFTEDGVSLARIADNPGRLKDRYGIVVRQYQYDTVNNTFSYNKGVEDLSAIVYQPDRVDYPFTYYASGAEPEAQTLVLYLEPEYRIQALFVPSAEGTDYLSTLDVCYMDGLRTETDTEYSIDSSIAALAVQSGISRLSTASDIMAFIEENDPTPAKRLVYHYYEDTNIYVSVDFEMPDSTGTMQSVTLNYEVTKCEDYFLQRSVEK